MRCDYGDFIVAIQTLTSRSRCRPVPSSIVKSDLKKLRYLHQNHPLDEIGLLRCKFLMQKLGMIYDYARVSAAAQDESGQVRQLKAAGYEIEAPEARRSSARSNLPHMEDAAPGAP
jgi:hypothetical protein